MTAGPEGETGSMMDIFGVQSVEVMRMVKSSWGRMVAEWDIRFRW